MTPTPTDTTKPAGPTPATGERDAQGRFAKGNRGGPGNPYNRQCAAFRKALHRAITDTDIEKLAATMLRKAQEGDVAAARLVFGYTIGRPTEAPDPDRVELDDWKLLQEHIGYSGEQLNAAINGIPITLWLEVLWIVLGTRKADLAAFGLARLRSMDEAEKAGEAGPPSANAANPVRPDDSASPTIAASRGEGQTRAPSVNGRNGAASPSTPTRNEKSGGQGAATTGAPPRFARPSPFGQQPRPTNGDDGASGRSPQEHPGGNEPGDADTGFTKGGFLNSPAGQQLIKELLKDLTRLRQAGWSLPLENFGIGEKQDRGQAP